MLVSNIRRVDRKWGYFLQFTENESSTVKLLHIKKGHSISYQYHEKRTEQWFLISGKIAVTKGVITDILLPGMTVLINKQEKHKLEGLDNSVVLEISKGFFDENDIVRL